MSLIDAAGTTFTFDGTAVGGIESYEFFRGEPRAITFRPVSAAAGVALPGQPDFGRCEIKLYRDPSDPGQVKLQASLDNRLTKTCVLTFKNGVTRTFQAFCLLLPVAGSKSTQTPVNLSSCSLRISGPVA